MALDQSALLELLDVMRSADGGDLMRRLLATMLQLLVDAEAPAFIGAEPHERSDARTNQRNGTREKLVATAAGDLTIKIPKVRTGSFFPSLLTPRRRVDIALHAVVMQAWIEGVSTRQVDDLVAALDPAERMVGGEPRQVRRVRLGAVSVAGNALLQWSIALLRRTGSDRAISTREGTTPVLVRAVRAGTLDVALITGRSPFCSPDQEQPRLRQHTVAGTTLAIAVPSASRHTGPGLGTLSSIGGESWTRAGPARTSPSSVSGPACRDAPWCSTEPAIGRRSLPWFP